MREREREREESAHAKLNLLSYSSSPCLRRRIPRLTPCSCTTAGMAFLQCHDGRVSEEQPPITLIPVTSDVGADVLHAYFADWQEQLMSHASPIILTRVQLQNWFTSLIKMREKFPCPLNNQWTKLLSVPSESSPLIICMIDWIPEDAGEKRLCERHRFLLRVNRDWSFFFPVTRAKSHFNPWERIHIRLAFPLHTLTTLCVLSFSCIPYANTDFITDFLLVFSTASHHRLRHFRTLPHILTTFSSQQFLIFRQNCHPSESKIYSYSSFEFPIHADEWKSFRCWTYCDSGCKGVASNVQRAEKGLGRFAFVSAWNCRRSSSCSTLQLSRCAKTRLFSISCSDLIFYQMLPAWSSVQTQEFTQWLKLAFCDRWRNTWITFKSSQIKKASSANNW